MGEKLERPMLLVGCGKMGGAMLEGWLTSGTAAAGVFIVEPFGAPSFEGRPGVTIVADAAALPNDLKPEVVVFAVKPQSMSDVVGHYKGFVDPGCLFVSVAAGTTIAFFERELGASAAVARAMPNTPSAVGQGMTVICPNANATSAQVDMADILLQAVGETARIDDEGLMDAVTGVSGSGPAYVFLMIECMAQAGIDAGLPAELAAKLAMQTVAGAGQLARSSDDPPDQLRRNVTSPNGTTQAALEVLMAEDGLQPLMTRAVAAAARRGKELAG